MNQKREAKKIFLPTTLIVFLVLGAPILLGNQQLPPKPKIVMKSCDVSILNCGGLKTPSTDARMLEALGNNDIIAIQMIHLLIVNNPGITGAVHSEATGKIIVKFYDVAKCQEITNMQSFALQPNERRQIDIRNPLSAGYYFLKKSKGVTFEVQVDSPSDSNNANNFKSADLNY